MAFTCTCKSLVHRQCFIKKNTKIWQTYWGCQGHCATQRILSRTESESIKILIKCPISKWKSPHHKQCDTYCTWHQLFTKQAPRSNCNRQKESLKPAYYSWTLVASNYRGQNQSTACLTVDPNAHTGEFFNGFHCHFDHPLNNTRRCFYLSKTINSFWPVNVLTGLTVFDRLLSALDIPWQVYQHFDWFWHL